MKANNDDESDKFQRHLRLLRDAVRAFYQFQIDVEETLKIALKSLLEDLAFDTTIVFLYDKSSDSLECAQAIMRKKGIIAGESRIPVTEKEDDLISAVFLGKKDYAIWGDGLQVCMGFRASDVRLGVLVADKLESKIPISREELDFLTDYVNEFSRGIQHIKIYQSNFRRIDMLLALSKISEAMASTMELKSVLSIILDSTIEILKFDRAYLYLVNEKDNLLEGKMSSDIRKIVKPITMEKYPLKAGVDRVVDALFEKNQYILESKYGTSDLVLYVPLIAKEAKIGVLVVDNIFSRQPITEEDKENLLTLANHAAVTIENASLYNQVKELSIRDSLTGLYTHGYFLQRLDEEIKRAARFKDSFSLLIVDVDNFKKYNDIYGHQVGDKIIEFLANLMKQKSRAIDIVGRYGGDEFVILAPRVSQDISVTVAKRLHHLIGQQKLSLDDKELTFSVSIGISTYPIDGNIKEELIKKADQALYWAKQHGRNRICSVKDIGRENDSIHLL